MKVRVLIARAPDGFWKAFGEDGESDATKMESAFEHWDGECDFVWLEAELPAPALIPVAQAEVVA